MSRMLREKITSNILNVRLMPVRMRIFSKNCSKNEESTQCSRPEKRNPYLKYGRTIQSSDCLAISHPFFRLPFSRLMNGVKFEAN